MSDHDKLILGTRGSALALWQADYVQRRLADAGVTNIGIKIIKTRGDRETALPFDQMQGQGFFTKEIEKDLLEGRIDLAVHSHKDLETTLPEGLQVTAVPQRADRREMLLVRPEAADAALPLGIRTSGKVGTSSIRRIAQLLYLRPDVQIAPLRGNVPTRVAKLRSGEYDAILVAAAGIRRLNLELTGLETIELAERYFLPPPAQGALAVQTRAGDQRVNALVARIDDPGLHEMAAVEREVLRRLGGGCHVPLGVVADRLKDGFMVTAFLGRQENGQWVRPRRITVIARTADEAAALVAGRLAAKGGHPGGQRFRGRKVVITRTEAETSNLRQEVASAGGELIAYPTLTVVAAGDSARQKDVLNRLEEYDWVVFSSGNGIRMFFALLSAAGRSWEGSIRAAVMGPGSAAIFERLAGRPPDVIPAVSTGEGFVEEFTRRCVGRKIRVLFPTTAERRGALETGLQDAGFDVDVLVVYNTTCPEPGEMPAWDGRADAVVLTSPKAAGFFLQLAALPPGAAIISIGPATTEFLVEKQIMPVYEALDHDLNGVLEVLDVLSGQAAPA